MSNIKQSHARMQKFGKYRGHTGAISELIAGLKVGHTSQLLPNEHRSINDLQIHKYSYL